MSGQWVLFIVFALLVSLFAPLANAASAEAGDSPDTVLPFAAAGAASVTDNVYLVSQDGSFRLLMNYTNFNTDAPPQKKDYAALFTGGAGVTNSVYGDQVFVKQFNAALQVDASGTVLKVIGPHGATDTAAPSSWDASQYVPIPPGGYVVLASDSSWGSSVYRKPLALRYKAGDTIALKKGDRTVTAVDFLPTGPGLTLTTATDQQVSSPNFTVAGQVANYTADQGLQVLINGTAVQLAADGSFTTGITLVPGMQTLTVKLLKQQTELAVKQLTVTYTPAISDFVEVEAAPIDITINIEGPRKKIDYIDKDVTGISNVLALYTRDYGTTITVPQYNVAVQVDAGNVVQRVVNPAVGGGTPVWTGPTELAIPAGGYVLYAQDSSYATYDLKRYLATKFKPGDIIKLRKNGNVVQIADLMSGNGPIAKLALDNYPMVTETGASSRISGRITNADPLSSVVLTANDTVIPVKQDGTFRYDYPLAAGINYVDVKVKKSGIVQDSRQLVIFSRPGFTSEKEVILWVDQAANARKFQSSQQVLDFLKKAKDNGVTSVVFDVKGVEGFASYKKNDLTGRPYVSNIRAPEKAGSNPDLDLLQEFVTHGHSLGLKIHAAINVFAEGSIASNEFAVLDRHLDWEERIHFAENNGVIKRVRESARKGLVAFVNPSNDEVRDYERRTFEEVIKNYEVDGVVHDRSRYDNESADFSDVTRAKFEAFLAARGKQLVNWPNDIFRYENNVRVNGPLIQDWWEFRSGTIKSFFGEVKELVEGYEQSTGRTIQVSAYVGSWYETYYLNGVNWGSPNFRFDSRLGLKDESVYTEEYYKTGYIEYLDFLMIGAYQTTGQEVEKYITLGNIVTNGELPLYAGIALTNVQAPALQREVFQAGLRNTHGLMLFDAAHVNWPIASAALRDVEYVKDYQLGMSLPGTPDGFLEGNYYNVNLIEGNINAFTDSFGPTTGTSRYGVEVVVDAEGHVTRVANRNQAINWSWGAPEENNSPIPQGGFVVSTLDPSGTRTNRQLVAHAYKTGDSVRAAVLSGYLPLEGKQTESERLAVTGKVEVLGPGQAEVSVNGTAAVVRAAGDFSATVPLALGSNTVTVSVYVDGYKTNSKSFQVVRKESSSSGSDSGSDSGTVVSGNPGTGTGSAGNPAAGRTSLLEETGHDGQKVLRLLVDRNRMLEDVKELRTQGRQSPELVYKADSSGGVLKLQLPVSGLKQALQDLPDGSIRFESSQGILRLPLAALSAALEKGQPDGGLVLTLSEAPTAGWARIAGDGEVLRAVEIRAELLPIDKGAAAKELDGFQGQTAVWRIPLPKAVNSDTVTAVLADPSAGSMTFIPAVFGNADGKTYAELRIIGSGAYAVLRSDVAFPDMKGHWAMKDVNLMGSKRIVNGMGDAGFVPEAPLTRAQFTALLVRALGLRPDAPETSFRDIQADDWFAGEAAAAVQAGIIEGDGDGWFRPNERLTREQLALMVQRAVRSAAGQAAAAVPESAGGRKGWTDRNAWSAWAEDAIAYAGETGLMTGRSDGLFEPRATATRAEGAVVLKRMLQLLGSINP